MKLNSKKNIIKAVAIYAIVLVIYNIVIFSIPFKHDATFKGAYIFGLVAIVAQVLVQMFSFAGANTLRKKVYALPIARMGLIYLCVQLLISIVFIIVSTFTDNFPGWIVLVVSVVLLGIFTILVLFTDTVRDNIEHIEAKEEKSTVVIKTLRNRLDSISRRVKDNELSVEMGKLCSAAKYSDPVSSEELSEIEAMITAKVDELETFIGVNDFVSAKTLAKEIVYLFEDRNALCKTYKKK